MGRPAHPNRDACIAWLKAHPEETYRAVGARFGVSKGMVEKWMRWDRERPQRAADAVQAAVDSAVRAAATVAATPRVPKPTGTRGPRLVQPFSVPANQLVVPAPKSLDPELTELARTAARNLLSHLASEISLKGASIKDVAVALKTLTDSYELLPKMDGAEEQAEKPTLTKRLLGLVPNDDVQEEDVELSSADEEDARGEAAATA